jgi:serine/threonine protein kinase
MVFNPEDVQDLNIDGTEYTVIQINNDPAAPMQTTTGRAHVCKLKDSAGNEYALKFYQDHIAAMFRLQGYDFEFAFSTQNTCLRDIPAFTWISTRKYISSTNPIVSLYPNLAHAILMPWIKGNTVSTLRAQIRDKSCASIPTSTVNKIACSLLESMVMLEERGYAHGDICSENIIVCEDNSVQIIDIEEMYIPTLIKPITLDRLPPGHKEYRFPHAFDPWAAEADRFSLAILLAEILTLQDYTAADIGADETLFTSHEPHLQTDAEQQTIRYNETKEAILQHFDTSFPTCLRLINIVFNESVLIRLPQIRDWCSLLCIHRIKEVRPHPTEYIKSANTETPILIVFLLDISQSMYYLHHDHIKRIDIALEMMNRILIKFREQSMQGMIMRPRYHFAFFGYHSKVINVFDTVQQFNSPIIKIDEFKEKKPFTIELINKVNPDGLRNNDGAGTNMTLAFESLYQFLHANIHSYQNCHPPFIFHITDGLNTGDGRELGTQFNNIQSLRTSDGSPLVSSFYISDSDKRNVDVIQDLTFCTPNLELKGTDEFKNAIRTLISVSSTIPDSYRTRNTTITIPDTAKFVFSFQSKDDVIKVAISIASGTGR